MVEFDFFGMEKEASAVSAPAAVNTQSTFEAAVNTQSTFEGILSAISQIHPAVIESAISPGRASHGLMPSTLPADHQSIPALSGHSSLLRSDSDNNNVAPLTIFYNGIVTVANVTSQKAESILKLALDSDQPTAPVDSSHHQRPPENLYGGTLLARRRSLATFMQKRKKRLKSESSLSLYTCNITDHPPSLREYLPSPTISRPG